MVALGQRNYNTLGKPMEGKVCIGHPRPGQNPLWRNQGRLDHLEPSMVQQRMDSDTQLLGNQEWQNGQIMGGRLEIGTKDGKPGQRDNPTGPHHTRKNQCLLVLEAGNIPQQMENLGQD